ncbi:hypothetical protein [Pseudemcibacter aquimaris]|uniref:hypothetical protein n=1 Tax=Pseudemcibacter aquimaris TaxID=2857064 RepID=UPI002012B629|nr:hypothetical protein [Pseudemcibacter aquimaris]MCC3859919.1 hypothetical protein [Pseudemcibacter aquimaris]WDU57251.1 hypothetical protein KW060_08575 [Pseudemcibacter aquimaris]
MKFIIKIVFFYFILNSFVFSQDERVVASNDFSLSGSITQVINAEDVRNVIIRCYCPNQTIKKNNDDKSLKLIIQATHDSVGYNSYQDIPSEINSNMLRFHERIIEDKIVLESQEFTYIHHAFKIDDLIINAPSDLIIKIEPISELELEGRKINE